MDDTDGSKHCGERRAHALHEYEVTGLGAEQGYSRLWSCDGSALPNLGPKRERPWPDGFRAAELNVTSAPSGSGRYVVVISQTYEVPAEGRMEAAMAVLEVLG